MRSLKILVRLTGPMVLSSKLNVQETETISSTLQRTGLNMVERIVQNSGKVLQTHTTEAAQRDTPYLARYSSKKIFRMHNISERTKSFNETEFSNCNHAKPLWLACQGYHSWI